jgi:hypothetical protein
MPYQKSSRIRLYDWLADNISIMNPLECYLWPGKISTTGYGIVYIPHTGKTTRAHRVAFYLVHGRWPMPQGRHTCDVRACFNPHHIVEGTQADNSRDMVERHRQGPMIRTGETNPFAKLTDDIVRRIRADHTDGLGYRKLAKKYKFGRTTIQGIILNRSWKHVI